jgi:hypothetical protein
VAGRTRAENGIRIRRRRSAALAGNSRLRGTKKQYYSRNGDKTMNGTLMQAALWVAAGLLLTLLITRRGKRKALG